MSKLQFSGLRRLPRSGNNSCCLSFEEINIFSSLSSRWTPAASSSNLFNSFTFNLFTEVIRLPQLLFLPSHLSFLSLHCSWRQLMTMIRVLKTEKNRLFGLMQLDKIYKVESQIFIGFYSPDTLDPPYLRMSSSHLSEVKKWEICVCCWCQSSLGSQSLPLYICNNYAFHFPPPPLCLEMGETGHFGGIICRTEDLWTILNFQTVGVM